MISIDRVQEYELAKKHRALLQNLLASCFPDFLGERIYYKQLPHFRFLVWDNQKLIAQMGVDHRVISIEEQTFRVFGIIDLCTAIENRNKGIGSKLLVELKNQASNQGIDFVVLFADDHRLYEKEGFFRVQNTCKWVGIDEHKTVGIFERKLDDCMMVVQTGSASWPDGLVDMMGYLF